MMPDPASAGDSIRPPLRPPTPQERRLAEAARSGDIGALRSAMAEGARNLPEALCAAVEANQRQAIPYLLDAGADPNPRDHNALLLAATCGQTEVVRLFLERGADPNLYGALEWAAMGGNLDTMEVLLDAGADPRGRGDAPLRCAVGSKEIKAARLLIEREADPEVLPPPARAWVEREVFGQSGRLPPAASGEPQGRG